MRRQIALLIGLAVFCAAMFCPLYASAATPLDPAADASLTLHYQKEEQTFSDLQINIYRVAEALPDGTFELIEPFASYPINIHDITMQEQWQNTAATLSSYIVANQLEPYRVEKTDETGTAVFEQLETGLFLVREVIAENNTGIYVFNQFMVYLPTPLEDGSFDYSVEANPKCVKYTPKTKYTVTKLWQDSGHQADRSAEIIVDIYKDGVLYESQTLNANNNWSYVWYVSEEDHSVWTVAERSTSEDYTVTVQQNGGHFSIINTHKSNGNTPDIPQTGDTTNLLPWVVAICFCGIVLITISIYGKRKENI